MKAYTIMIGETIRVIAGIGFEREEGASPGEIFTGELCYPVNLAYTRSIKGDTTSHLRIYSVSGPRQREVCGLAVFNPFEQLHDVVFESCSAEGDPTQCVVIQIYMDQHINGSLDGIWAESFASIASPDKDICSWGDVSRDLRHALGVVRFDTQWCLDVDDDSLYFKVDEAGELSIHRYDPSLGLGEGAG